MVSFILHKSNGIFLQIHDKLAQIHHKALTNPALFVGCCRPDLLLALNLPKPQLASHCHYFQQKVQSQVDIVETPFTKCYYGKSNCNILALL